MNNNGSDILIVGAGAAGLAAARDLSLAGRKVIVLEARDRIGGRIFTNRDPSSPIPIELGAEFVHGKSPEVWEIAQRAQLRLVEVTERHWHIDNGKISKSGDFWPRIAKLFDEMKSLDGDESFDDFLSLLPDDEESRRIKAMAIQYVEGFNAASKERIGIQGLVKANDAADSIDGDKSFRLVDGYALLMEALKSEAESHGGAIYLQTTVKEIRWSGDGIVAVCGDKNGLPSFAAPQVIITLPLGVLQASSDQRAAVRFIPDLPHDKRDAINTLVMGNAVRLVLRFRERFWEQLSLSDEDKDSVDIADVGFIHNPDAPFPTWWTQLPTRAPILVGWAGGPNADRLIRGSVREGLTHRTTDLNDEPSHSLDAFILDQAITSLSLILNTPTEYIRDQIEASYIHDWHSDPFSRGAYSYLPVNGSDAQKNLLQPIANKLFLAGEATSLGHVGTVHGAIQTGQRAAKEILAEQP